MIIKTICSDFEFRTTDGVSFKLMRDLLMIQTKTSEICVNDRKLIRGSETILSTSGEIWGGWTMYDFKKMGK